MHALYRFFGLMLLMVVLSFVWAQLTTGHAADEHRHEAAHGKLTLDHGEKWQTDAPLRVGMTRIRNTMNAKLHAIHEDKLGAADYTALGRTIDEDLAYIFRNCKLPPDADAMLHLLLAEVMQGTKAMKGEQPGTKPRDGAVGVVHALHQYAAHFDHPGFKPPKH
jgi:hypothetical protein